MAQLSYTVNPSQPGTLPRNTIKNSKNDRHCMAVITRGGKQTIDQPTPSGGEDERTGVYEVVEVSGELVDKSGKEAEIPQKVTRIPIPPPPFLQRLVKIPRMVNNGLLLLC